VTPGIQIGAILMQQLHDLHAAVDAPEERQVVALIDVVGIRARPQQRLAALVAPSAWQ
jgi:hypothetical protein